jgi:hypothetical protein
MIYLLAAAIINTVITGAVYVWVHWAARPGPRAVRVRRGRERGHWPEG